MELYAELNAAKLLYVTLVHEEDTNLKFEVVVTGVGNPETFKTRFSFDESSLRYRITFKSYIAYSVIDEGYCNSYPDETYQGDVLRIYAKSPFLDYLTVETFATHDYPGPFRHYQIVALDHIVNVASMDVPVIEKIN